MKSIWFFLSVFLFSLSAIGSEEANDEQITPEIIDTLISSSEQSPFKQLDQNLQIILDVDAVSDNQQWLLTYQMIQSLYNSGWLRSVVWGSFPADGDTQALFSDFNDMSSENLSMRSMINLFGNHIAEMGELNLLLAIRKLQIPVFPGATVSGGGSEVFYKNHTTEHSLKARYAELEKIYSTKTLRALTGVLMRAHPSNEQTFRLDAQVSRDEATAYYSRHPGTLVIMPLLFHASKKYGIGAVLSATTPYGLVTTVFISSSEEQLIERKFIPKSVTDEHILQLRYTAQHFHHWYVPKP